MRKTLPHSPGTEHQAGRGRDTTFGSSGFSGSLRRTLTCTLGSRTPGLCPCWMWAMTKAAWRYLGLACQAALVSKALLPCHLPESTFQLCSPIPKPTRQLFKNVKAVGMCSSLGRKKKNPGPINHYSSDGVYASSIRLPFFKTTLILPMSEFLQHRLR